MDEIGALLEDPSTTIARARQLFVNSEIMADVVFLVGQAQVPVRAHKIFLASASSVFYRMFCGGFQDQATIKVPDIAPEVFQELLKHIYVQTIDLRMDTVFDVWYGAEKYALNELLAQCVKFVLDNVTSANALEALCKNQLIDNVDVNKVCLELIGENPYEYLDDPNFLELPVVTFVKIMKTKRVNCSPEDLVKVAIGWLNHQNGTEHSTMTDAVWQELHQLGLTRTDLVSKKFSFGLEVDPFGMFTPVSLKSQTLQIKPTRGHHLTGLGIILGIEGRLAADEESVTVTVERDEETHFQKEFAVSPGNVIHIMPIMFRKLALDSGMIFVKIEFETCQKRWVSNKFICAADCHSTMHDCSTYRMRSKTMARHSLVAYLIEK